MTPYETLDDRAFWAPSVGHRNMFDIGDLWRPKFGIDRATGIVTFGSCFAQHFSGALTQRGYTWLDREPPLFGLSATDARAFNYGVFSARTGNIYTATLLRQWVRWALNLAAPADEAWSEGGRFHDPFRPTIEPDGFDSVEELVRSRQATIEAFRRCIAEAGLFVFTLGLTESWWQGSNGDYEYPMCPGTVAGTFDADRHVFVNQDYETVRDALSEAVDLMRGMNPELKVLLTVSPVPLTATNSGNHVLVATMESKSVLRAVAAKLSHDRAHVDYFPSYEIISAAPFRGAFFEANMRNVSRQGVDHVMRSFFSGIGDAEAPTGVSAVNDGEADLVCEEELLSALRSGPTE